MYIKNFQLYNFRNYRDQKINFEQGINLLIGSNGQGKTNVIEGIYYLLTGKSSRSKQENELINWGEKSFYLQGSFKTLDREIKLQSYYEPGKKVIKINQLACKRLSDYVGTVNAVSFSPDDLDIVKKSPNERRRFIDILISQIRPIHISLLNSYLRVIRQKNMLLRLGKKENQLINQLQAWNEQILEIGSKIIINRWEFTEKINQHCHSIFKSIFSAEDSIDIFYMALGKKNLDEALQFFPEVLETKMKQEIERKMVLIGPHRDDLLINLNGKAARIFASQGQQRSIVLSLKLAEMEIILDEKGEYPILLLDDVLSELDEFRREYLIAYINSTDKQTIITMTGADKKIISTETAIYKVAQGNIWRE